MSEDYHCDEDDSLEILNRIPDNPSTMPFRHWVTGSLPSEHLGIDDCIEALLWSDHGVAIRAVDEPSDRTYYVDHNGDLQALAGECEISSPNEAAVMLDGDLDAAAVDVVAILIEDAPVSVRAIGKEIVTDGGRDFVEQNAGRCDICGKLINMDAGDMLTTATYGVDEEIKAEHDLTDEDAINGVADALERVADSPAGYDLAETIRETGEMRAHVSCLNETNYSELETDIEPDDGLETDGGQQVSDSAARVYCSSCKCWRSLDDGNCNICGETIAETEAEETRVGHCKHDATDVYAGRGRGGRDMLSVAEPGQRGWLGNPFTLDDHSRAESIRAFRQAFEDKLQRDDEFRAAVADLAGKTLGCWCQHVSDSEPGCHAEVIAEWADKLAEQGDAALDDADRIVTDGGRPPLRRCSECGGDRR